MPPLRIEPTLLRLFQDCEGTLFTRDKVLKDYCTLSDEHGRSARASRQFIDRNLIRLSNAGVLTKVDAGPGGPQRYRFNPPTGAAIPASTEALSVLRQKLQHHRVELLSTIGETEAYDEICADLPQLQSSVQKQYDEARDRSLKLLGRIRALETLISVQRATAS